MKNKIVLWASIGLIAFALMISSSRADAATANILPAVQIQAQIDALMARLKLLQQQLSSSAKLIPVQPCFVFTRDLEMGMSVADVVYLHDLLIKKGYLTPTGSQTSSLFEEATRLAVISYQSDYGLPATGYVGPITRAKLNTEPCVPGHGVLVPEIAVIYPNSPSDTLTPNLTDTRIVWTSNYNPSLVTIKINGSGGNFAATTTSGTATSTYIIPRGSLNLSTGAYMIEICDPTREDPRQEPGKELCDSGQSYFNIDAGSTTVPTRAPSIRIISPNGGETFSLNETIQVSYAGVNLSDSLQVYLYSFNDAEVVSATDVYASPLGTGKGTINLNLSKSTKVIAPGQYNINLCDHKNSPEGLPGKSLCDHTDAVINIVAAPTQPVVTGTAKLIAAEEDRVSTTFSEGKGTTGYAADWYWRATLKITKESFAPITKKIKSLTLYSLTTSGNLNGEGWSTSASSRNELGKGLYPLLIVGKAYQNTKYDENLLISDINSQGVDIDLFGQVETPRFSGGKLVATFTDGTSATVRIPSSSIKPSLPSAKATISLKSNDVSIQNPSTEFESIRGVFNVTITAIGGDLTLPMSPAKATVVNEYTNEKFQPASIVFDMANVPQNGSSYVIKDGTSASARISAYFDGKNFPKDIYKVVLDSIAWNQSSIKNPGDWETQAVTMGSMPATEKPIEVKSDSLSASFNQSSTDDFAGMWGNFSKGTGNINKTAADWSWNITLNTYSQKTIQSINVTHSNPSYEGWSTDDVNKYPLVILKDGVQLNSAYGQTFGPYAAGEYKFVLYGQRETATFGGSKIVVRFTDGTSVSATLSSSGNQTASAAQSISEFFQRISSLFNN